MTNEIEEIRKKFDDLQTGNDQKKMHDLAPKYKQHIVGLV
jgi:hypothetical protein